MVFLFLLFRGVQQSVHVLSPTNRSSQSREGDLQRHGAVSAGDKNTENHGPPEHRQTVRDVQRCSALLHGHCVRVVSKRRLCTGGELLDRIIGKKFFSERDAAQMMRQLLSAVAYCHSKRVVHRDLKLENLLLSSHAENASLKIIDFGMAQTFDSDSKMSARIGTPLYIAPEVLSRSYTEKCDIWSCGVILYMLLSGLPPFISSNEVELYQKIQRCIYTMSGARWNGISKEAKDLVQRILVRDPERRYSALEALSHPWIQGYCESSLDCSEARTLLTEVTSFNPKCKLQQAVLVYIVSQLLSDKEKMKVHSLFLSLDKDKDGRLCVDELMEGYKECFGERCPEKRKLQEMMKRIDVAGDGYIELTEFAMAAINKKKLLSTKRLIAAFKLFDLDGNGLISAEEIKQVLGKGVNVSDEHWKELVREVDLDGDGQISLEEFITMMYSPIKDS
eukprot:TRINITY_DN7999_c0_g1_i10.p1 TRINITY_DN7999_c0_g1~~TRINITY_DN7999_c0_g1_i10.p1  ORF type:complete len:449 (-),score=72.14 TRINITY_DN7999_c0_g1_i10:75-1421(-)